MSVNWTEIVERAMAARFPLDLPRNIKLPCLPQSVIEFTTISNDPAAGPKELAAPIQSDSALTEIDNELTTLRANQINEPEVTRLLANFHHTWEALAPRDQARVLDLLIERIDYRGREGQISLTLRPSGIQTLTQETVV